MLLKGKNAIITGSNRGIGHAILETFAKEGCATIWAHARKESVEFSKDIAALSAESGAEIIPIYFDVTDTDSLKQEIKSVIKTKKPIDILVNNAGVAHGGLFQMTPVSKIKEVFDVNLFAGMEITQLLSRVMTKQHSGSIINISSSQAFDLMPGNSAYGVSKAAVAAWTKILGGELGQSGVRVNAVAPGLTDTSMGSYVATEGKYDWISETAMGRMAEPEEIANVVAFLASDNASYLNGQVILVDGGRKHGLQSIRNGGGASGNENLFSAVCEGALCC